jgi:hypothetical protein
MIHELKRRNNKRNKKERVKAKLPKEVTSICSQCGVNLYGKEKLPRRIVNEKREKGGAIHKWCTGCPDFKPCLNL